MLAQAEGRHQLEHRHFDVARRLAGTLSIEEPGQHGVGQMQARHFVGGDARRIERRAVTHLEQSGKARGRLDHVVVGGLAGVAAVSAEADGRGVDDAGIGGAHGLVGEAEPVEGLLAHVVHEGVGGGDQLHERRLPASRFRSRTIERLLRLLCEDDAAAGARGAWADIVALRRLDLDHLGAQVAQDLRRVGPEHDGGQVDNAEALRGGITAGLFRKAGRRRD